MSSAEEEDYMSEKFLYACENGTNKDVKPGLISSYSERRKKVIEERKELHDELNRQAHPSVKVIELQNRVKGLNKPLEESNKGFELLKKMGYTPGTAIGKSAKGRLEPVLISLKTDREGLGKQQQRVEKYKSYKEQKQATEVTTSSYRSSLAEKFTEKKIRKDLFDCQRSCQFLDRKKGITKPVCEWYWLDSADVDNDSDISEPECDRYISRRNIGSSSSSDQSEVNSENEIEEATVVDIPDVDMNNDTLDDDIPMNEKLETLTKYLRDTHFYCIWCGVEYNDVEDLVYNCPGNTSDAHD